MGRNTKSFKDLISARFTMEDLGNYKFFLGMDLERDLEKRTITLHQDKYAEAMLEEYGMKDFLPCKRPVVPNTHLTPASPEDAASFEATGGNYRREVGLFNYLFLCT